MINHHDKFIFIHIPKCGGTSIESVFKAWNSNYSQNYFYLGDNRQHFFLSDILKEYPDCSNYFKFSFVRNPFSRIVSEYQYILSKNIEFQKEVKFKNFSFKDFASDFKRCMSFFGWKYHDYSLSDYLLNEKDELVIDFIGRLEYMQQDFDIICDKIGIQKQKLPHTNKSKHKHYTEYYDDETREMVAEIFARDIEYFGYKFGE